MDTTRLRELASAVIEELGEDAKAEMLRRNTTLSRAVVTLFTPYLNAVTSGTDPKELRDADDKRKRKWSVGMLVIDPVGKRVVETEGRVSTYDGRGNELVEDNGVLEIVIGLDGVAAFVRECLTAVGAHPDLAERLDERLSNLRPTISVQGGHATLRRGTEDGRWIMVLDVWRAENAPPTAYKPRSEKWGKRQK